MDPLCREGIAIPQHQALLRELGVIERVRLMMEVAFNPEVRRYLDPWRSRQDGMDELVTSPEAKAGTFRHLGASASTLTAYPGNSQAMPLADLSKHPSLTHILKLCYKLIANFLLGHDVRNELHVARHFDFMQTHVGVGLGAGRDLIQYSFKQNQFIVKFTKSSFFPDFLIDFQQ
jgi:hypothetical protein